MGYYTSYTLKADKQEDEIGSYIESGVRPDLKYIFENSYDNEWYGDSRWYEHDAEMCDLSLVFPDVLFTLTGEGEESGDIWRKWYRNGVLLNTWTLDYKMPEFPLGWTK
jgi:hypothetical protein